MKSLLILLLMTDVEALTRAKQIWGNGAFVRQVGKNYQVGCVETVRQNRIVVGESKVSYEDAFSKVNMWKNGPRVIGAEARDTAGNRGQAYEKIVFICNK